MKKLLTLSLGVVLLSQVNLSAQTNTFPASGSVGVGTTTPVSSSLLELQSTTQGLLAPRMTKAQRDAIAAPVTGLLIFQTNSTPDFIIIPVQVGRQFLQKVQILRCRI